MKWVRLAVLPAFVLAAASGEARAHGPCGCTEPVVAAPGTQVVTGPAYRIVLNPPATLFRGAAGSPELASAHRPDAPTTTLLDRPRPPWPKRARRGRFTLPQDTPPGLYLLLVYDGSEGGAHATWDYLHVPDPPLDPEHGELHELMAGLSAVLPPL